MHEILQVFNMGLLQNTLRTATPVILCAMGGLMTEQAGLMNIGMDGMMVIGCFTAVALSYFLASSFMGVLGAVICGTLIGLFFALFVVRFKSDEFIIGMAINTFAGALTVYLLRSIFGVKGTFASADIVPLPTIHIGLLDKIPFIGTLLNDNSLFVYITWLFVFMSWFFLYRTPYGFWLRAAGEHPESLETSGVSPKKMKLIASVLCGIMCGFAGAHLSLGYLTMFTEGMHNSRGFTAFACVIFGMANPPKVFLAALLFGFMEAVGLRLQSVGVPSNLSATVPYLATVLMLVYITVSKRRKKKKIALKELKEK